MYAEMMNLKFHRNLSICLEVKESTGKHGKQCFDADIRTGLERQCLTFSTHHSRSSLSQVYRGKEQIIKTNIFTVSYLLITLQRVNEWPEEELSPGPLLSF